MTPEHHDTNENDFAYPNRGDEEENGHQNKPGPGFFNPATNSNGFNNEITRYTEQDLGHQQDNGKAPFGKPEQHIVHANLPPELYNILGGNNPGIPPHVHIEQLLQHIQGGNPNQSPDHNLQNQFAGHQNGVNYPFVNDLSHQGIPVPPPRQPTGGDTISFHFIKRCNCVVVAACSYFTYLYSRDSY